MRKEIPSGKKLTISPEVNFGLLVVTSVVITNITSISYNA